MANKQKFSPTNNKRKQNYGPLHIHQLVYYLLLHNNGTKSGGVLVGSIGNNNSKVNNGDSLQLLNCKINPSARINSIKCLLMANKKSFIRKIGNGSKAWKSVRAVIVENSDIFPPKASTIF